MGFTSHILHILTKTILSPLIQLLLYSQKTTSNLPNNLPNKPCCGHIAQKQTPTYHEQRHPPKNLNALLNPFTTRPTSLPGPTLIPASQCPPRAITRPKIFQTKERPTGLVHPGLQSRIRKTCGCCEDCLPVWGDSSCSWSFVPKLWSVLFLQLPLYCTAWSPHTHGAAGFSNRLVRQHKT